MFASDAVKTVASSCFRAVVIVALTLLGWLPVAGMLFALPS